jgi:hypothetical protein
VRGACAQIAISRVTSARCPLPPLLSGGGAIVFYVVCLPRTSASRLSRSREVTRLYTVCTTAHINPPTLNAASAHAEARASGPPPHEPTGGVSARSPAAWTPRGAVRRASVACSLTQLPLKSSAQARLPWPPAPCLPACHRRTPRRSASQRRCNSLRLLQVHPHQF